MYRNPTDEFFNDLTSRLGYSDTGGLIYEQSQAKTGTQLYFFERARESLGVTAVYFGRDTPLVYFFVKDTLTNEDICDLHRRVWNDGRVPLLFVITRSEVRLYDCFASPTLNPDEIEDPSRLIRNLSIANATLSRLRDFSRKSVETGLLWNNLPGYFDPNSRCDQTLLKNLRLTQQRLIRQGVPTTVVQRLLSRLILIMYLEHRKVLSEEYYKSISAQATSIIDLLVSRELTFNAFEKMAGEFNGDLLPVDVEERIHVKQKHFTLLQQFFCGEELDSGQTVLWQLYDFSIIPIQLISAIYETFLRGDPSDSAEQTDTNLIGTFYSPIYLVELLMNEVIPWPGPNNTAFSPLPKVLDPSCGSGIFLVEAYRRIIAHWRYQNQGKYPGSSELHNIMVNCIYGLDIDASAVQVAAFSLYLAFLESLDSISLRGQFKFPPLTRPGVGHAVANLVSCNAFSEHQPFQNVAFDFVVGNPPWRRNYLPEGASEYCKSRGYPIAKEIAHAFMWLALKQAPKGKIALLCTSKWLFNREKPDVEFRRTFLSKAYVETIINLSVMRLEKLFPGAVGPASAVICRGERPEVCSPSILYCTPKPGRGKVRAFELIIDGSDLKWLPRHEAERSDDIWKVLMWGTFRDLDLVRKVKRSSSSLANFFREKKQAGWCQARGFQPYTVKNKSKKAIPQQDDAMAQLAYIKASDIDRYFVDTQKLASKCWTNQFIWTGPKEIYRAPHVLIKEGQKQGRFCAALADTDCTFQDTITGVAAPIQHIAQLKALTAYLNSRLATYFLFLTASTWGIERERVKKTEVFDLPDTLLRDEGACALLAKKFDELRSASSDDTRALVEREMDVAVYKALGITSGEQVLVEDMINYTIDYFQKGQLSHALKSTDRELLKEYAMSFFKVINPVLRAGGSYLSATLYIAEGLSIVSFVRGRGGDSTVRFGTVRELNGVLADLERVVEMQESPSVYIRRTIKIYQNDSIHIVKTSERRYWAAAVGMRDADETMYELLGADGYAG